MSTFRYNVVVAVSIDTDKMNRGNQAQKQVLRQMESEVVQSQKRIDKELQNSINQRLEQEKRFTDANARNAAFRRQSAIDDYKAQTKAHEKGITDRIAAMQKEQQAINQNYENHRKVVRQMQIDEARRATVQAIEQRKLAETTIGGVQGQTASQRASQGRLQNYASSTISKEMDNINRIINGQKILDADRNLKNLTKTTNDSTKSLGMWGQAFKGAFIGAVAGITFSTIVSGITGIVSTVKDLAIESVKLAGDFETTTNALTVFTGSTQTAKQELAEIGKIALNTPGLTLESAETGYQRLRALNFEAKIAQDLIKGLGTQRVLSGAGTDAVDRVITNLVQLTSGAATAQDVRQTIGQLPTLLPVLKKSFGTTDFGDINQAFKNNPDEAIAKFTAELAKARQAEGGLNVASENLYDTFIDLGRAAGEPLLDPLTQDIRDLTKYFQENRNEVASWGVYVADIVRGVGSVFREVNDPNDSSSAYTKRGILAASTFGVSESVIGIANLFAGRGEIERKKKEVEQREKNYAFGASRLDKSTNTFDFSNGGKNLVETDDAREIRLAQEENKRETALKAANQAKLQILENGQSLERERIENYYKVTEARLSAHIDYTTEQELRSTQIVGKNRLAGISAQIAATKNYYAEIESLNVLSGEDLIKSNKEKTETLNKLNTDYALAEISLQKETAEFEKRIAEEKRQAIIESKNLEIQEANQLNDQRVSQLQRAIERETVDTQKGYDLLKTYAVENLNEVTKITKERYDKQLEDLSLTTEQRNNIQKQRDLELQNLTEQNRQKLLEIDDASYQSRLKKVEQFYERQKSVLQSAIELSQTGASLLSPESFINNSSEFIQRSLTGTTLKDARDSVRFPNAVEYFNLKDQIEAKDKLLDNARQNNDAQKVIELSASISDLNEKLIVNRKTWDNWRENINDDVLVIGDLVEKIKSGSGTIEDIDRLGLEALKRRQSLAIGLADAEIKTFDERIKIAKKNNNSLDVEAFTYSKLNAERAKNNLLASQEAEVKAYLTQTTEGLTKSLDKLRSADPETMSFLNKDFKDTDLRKQTAQYTELYRLQYEIANSPLIDNLAIEIAMREDILELRNRETEAIIASNRAELELGQAMEISNNQIRARVLDHLAQQTTMNEAISDGIIKIYDTAIGKIDKLLDKAGIGKIPIIGDIAKAGARNVLSNITRNVLDKFLPPELSDALNSTGNPELDEAKKQTNELKQINANTRTGTSITNNFRVNQNGGGATQVLGVLGSLLGVGGQSRTNGASVNPGDGITGVSTTIQGILNGGSGSGIAGGSGGGILGKIFGKGGIFGEKGFGNNQGTFSAIGAGAGILGGAIGGIAGNTISMAGTGLSIGFQFGGPVGAAIGAGVGAVVGLISGIIGRNSKRKKEEKIRNQAIGDAFAAIDKLIAQVNNDQIDGNSAIEQADSIRNQYVESMSQLTDKKTRSHALQDVSRIDQKIEQLKAAVGSQNARRQRLELYAPTFADGGSLSRFGQDNYRHNPLGYQKGGQKLGYFPSSNQYAIFNERGSEYIFDAETTRNIGVGKLDLIRETKGSILNSMLFRLNDVQRKADGGTLSASSSTQTVAAATSQPIQIHLHVDGSAMGEMIAQAMAVSIQNNDGSSSQLAALSRGVENQGQVKFMEQLAQMVADKLRKNY